MLNITLEKSLVMEVTLTYVISHSLYMYVQPTFYFYDRKTKYIQTDTQSLSQRVRFKMKGGVFSK